MPDRPVLRSFFTGGCFIAVCAVALSLEVSVVTGIRLQGIGFYLFVFFATWSSYRLHDLLQPSRRWRTALLLAAAFASACSLRVVMLPWIALSTVLSLAYSLPVLPSRRRLREWGLLKIISLVGVWTIVTAYLPAQGQLDAETMAMLLTRRFLFMFALCLAFDARDRSIDAHAGIRTLPVLIGDRGTIAAIRVALLAFAALVLVKPFMGSLHHAAMPIAIALLVSAIASWLAIERVRRRPAGRMYYLCCVDGMMATQGLLVLLAVCSPAHKSEFMVRAARFEQKRAARAVMVRWYVFRPTPVAPARAVAQDQKAAVDFVQLPKTSHF